MSIIEEIIKKFEKLTYSIENDGHSEEKLLRTELNGHNVLKNTRISLTECHIIACIGANGSANGTFIAKTLNITKGSVSKTAAKLTEKNLINTERLPNNKKEIHYTLTRLGQELYRLHENMHGKAKDEFALKLEKFTAGELKTIRAFLDIINK